MSDGTGIAWTDSTWSPLLGCTPAGKGCTHCYAVRDTWRMAHNPNAAISTPRQGLVEPTAAGVLRWTGKVALLPEQLEVPLRWRRPRRIFVANQADLFHPAVPDDFIRQVFDVMARASQHTYQLLTKRPARAREFLARELPGGPAFPHVWLGYSASTQAELEAGMPDLRATNAAVRYLSLEPLLDPIDLGPWLWAQAPGRPRLNALQWVIVGGESGPGARSCWVPWIRRVVAACRGAELPVFVKQLGAHILDRNDAGWDGCAPADWPEHLEAEGRVEDDKHDTGYQGAPVRVRTRDRKGADPSEWPADLRVQQWPEVRR